MSEPADAASPGRASPQVVAVIGSRIYPNREDVERWFGENWREGWHLVSGGAGGVDTWAEIIAATHGDEPDRIPPNWDAYPAKQYGKDYAPKLRNKEIVDRCDRLVAFWDGRSGGTAFTIAWATYRGKPVTVRLATNAPLRIHKTRDR